MSLILTNIKKHAACSYGYKLVCLDDKFSNPFKSYLGEDALYIFIITVIEESKYCSDVMEKHFNKELVIIKKDNEDFQNTTTCRICDNDYIDNDVKERNHCHITAKYRGPAYTDCNINFKLNHKILVVFHNLKRYDSHLTIQELSKFIIKINVIPNGLENYVGFSINTHFQFLSSSLVSLKKLNEHDFNYLSQEFDNNNLDLVRKRILFL